MRYQDCGLPGFSIYRSTGPSRMVHGSMASIQWIAQVGPWVICQSCCRAPVLFVLVLDPCVHLVGSHWKISVQPGSSFTIDLLNHLVALILELPTLGVYPATKNPCKSRNHSDTSKPRILLTLVLSSVKELLCFGHSINIRESAT